MENEHLNNLLRDHVLERDRMEFSAGDTLDVKAGLLLAILTFLAIQASDLLKDPICHTGKVIGNIAIAAMIAGGILAICQLFPRNYCVRSSPKKYAAWLTDVEKHFHSQPSHTHKANDYVSDTEISQAIERVEENSVINKGVIRRSPALRLRLWLRLWWLSHLFSLAASEMKID